MFKKQSDEAPSSRMWVTTSFTKVYHFTYKKIYVIVSLCPSHLSLEMAENFSRFHITSYM